MRRRIDADWQGHDPGHHKRRQRHDHGQRQPVADHVSHRSLIFQGEAEITFQNEAHPAHILDGLGLIGAVLRTQCLHLLR